MKEKKERAFPLFLFRKGGCMGGLFPIHMRDIRFVLFEQLGIEQLCARDRFQDFSRETFEMVLEEAAKLAAQVIAPLNPISDKEGCTLENPWR
jgi:hypothetical protein